MDDNYELYISTTLINPMNGRFRNGHIPFNKGIPMKEWMDGRKIRKVLKCLELGRKQGNKQLAGSNQKMVVGIKDGKLTAFKSATDAAKILKAKGVKINRRNINTVCHEKEQKSKFGKYEYSYVRKKAGGYVWYFEKDIEKYKDLLT